VERYSTDSIWNVSHGISKDELRPGDALNLTTGRDPRRLGHIRLFEAWANPAHTVMWVYEETEPRSMHRVVVYDDRYQPIRLAGLSGDGVALIVPGTPAPEKTATPRTPKPTLRPTVRPTPRPTVKVTPRPTAKPVSSGATTPRPTPTPASTTR
jgi:outer membrane biosynthesis protein TonB